MVRKMKDSGVEWIGEIPEDWEVSRVKNVSNLNGRIGFRGYKQTDLVEPDQGAITLGPPNIEDGTLKLSNCKFISWDKYYESPEIQLSEGDVLLVKTASVGKVAYVDTLEKEMTVNPQLLVVKSKNINSKFLYYLFSSKVIQYQIRRSTTGGTVPTLSQEKINDFYITWPPISAQTKISDMLDGKCIEIEKNSELINREIETLEAYKKSVITEAVTKGLDKNAEMKDSGIEWIGEIPKHWEVVRIKDKGNSRNGLTYSPSDICGEEEGTLVLRSSNIRNSKIVFENTVYVDKSIPNSLKTKVGDILICSRNGSRELIGKNAIIDIEDASFGAFMMIYRTENYRLMFYILNSSVFSYYLGTFFTSTINQLTNSNFENMKIVWCPDEKEQEQLVNYLDKKTQAIDDTIAIKRKQLAVLDEYKKSLIYEYVTGKREV